MLGDAETRPSSYGNKKGKYLDFQPYRLPGMAHDLILFDPECKEYLGLVEIFREIKDDDHADEFTMDSNWQATDKSLK